MQELAKENCQAHCLLNYKLGSTHETATCSATEIYPTAFWRSFSPK